MNETYKYDVAISFAEEDKEIASNLSFALESVGLKSYYYPDNRVENLGQNLEESLTRIYTEEAKYAIVLFSKSYLKEEKIYTKIELAAIQGRMQEDSDIVYMLPIRLDKDISLDEHPDIDKITFVQWNENYKEIVIEIKKLLGKGLIHSDECANSDNITYSYGDDNQSLIIEGVNKGSINQTIINTKHIYYVIDEDISKQLGLKRPDKTNKYSCPSCLEELVGGKSGNNRCEKCGETFYIENIAPDTLVKGYKSLDTKESKDYNKIRAHIRNKINDKDYKAAYQYSLKAEEIAPAEAHTWVHFAMTVFLLEIFEEKSNRNPSFEIIKSVKPYFDKCLMHGISDNDYNSLLKDIADKLFAVEKSRINSFKARFKDDFGYNKWTRQEFQYLQGLLRSFEVCYSLHNNLLFLEEYVNELTKPRKWMVVDRSTGEIKNTKNFGGFNAYEKFKLLVNKIKEQKNDFIPPGIEKEIFDILSSTPFEEEKEIIVDNTIEHNITIKLVN